MDNTAVQRIKNRIIRWNENAENKWRRTSKRKRLLLYFALYTVCFTALFFLSYHTFLENGRSFIWSPDGKEQHFPTFVYIGDYLRSIVKNILQGNFSIPFFDFNSAYGANLIPMLNLFDGFGDPLTLLSVFFPAKYAEFGYSAVLILRIYLVGVAFSAFCFYMKKRMSHTLIGAVVYVFCGYLLVAGIRHPAFITPMIYFPLLVLGLDKIIKKEKPYIFIVTLCLAFINGYYFAYVSTLLLVVYAIIRFFSRYKTHRVKAFIQVVLRSVAFYATGMLMSCVILLPAVCGFLNSVRTSGSKLAGSLWHHESMARYMKLFADTFSVGKSGDRLGLSVFVFLAILVLFVKKTSGRPALRSLKIGVLVGLVFLYVPFFGYVANAFSYLSGRWTFTLSFFLAFATVYMMPYLLKLSRKEQIVCSLGFAGFAAFSLFGNKVFGFYNIIALVCMAVTYAVLLLLQPPKEHKMTPLIKNIGAAVCLMLVCMNIVLNTQLLYRPSKIDYVSDFLYNNQTMDGIEDSPYNTVKPFLKADEYYRVDTPERFANVPMVLGVPGLQTLYSIFDRKTSETLIDLQNSGTRFQSSLLGLNQRATLNTLASVKYFVAQKGRDEESVPYGYTKIGAKTIEKDRYRTDPDTNGLLHTVKPTEYEIYENQYALPVGYTYASYITSEDYEKLSVLEKQEALLQSIVLEEEIPDYPKGAPAFTSESISSAVKSTDSVMIEGKNVVVEKDSGSITLSFKGRPESETYLSIIGFDINGTGQGAMSLFASTGKRETEANFHADENHIGFRRKDAYLNLGYSEQAQDTVKITFPKAGTYHLDGFEIYCQPMNHYAQQATKLGEEPLENIVVQNNKVTGRVELSADKILCIGLASRAGWTAFVDGKKAPLYAANGMHMALPLTKGQHDIELCYRPPGLTAGIVLSVVGVLLLIGIVVFYRRKISK